ncbi:hypothetical protein C7974DRAFT_415496 [Boeremia exigua]|uniref:uncharacterized protein n=1 Tax=Boeremia exigua TaxID=749465 RepID=UPI001E8DC22A|nr:uncharacterized protein C7974DRAFT_415496 [Boeremia exigua]KAH6620284.1 hypothetical protein C7974DRAFT_415496 [Boeremia exigua]
MKSTVFTAVAVAASLAAGFELPSHLEGNTTSLAFVAPLAARWKGDCEPLCEKYRNYDQMCISGGAPRDCRLACISKCYTLHESDSDSPSSTDLLVIHSELSEWQYVDPIRDHSDSSGDERHDIPCLGWCKRNATVPASASSLADAQAAAMVDRVAAYGQVYQHLDGIVNMADVHVAALPPVGTTLDMYLVNWVRAFEEQLAAGGDLAPWFSELYGRAAACDLAPGRVWAYRFEMVANKITDRELKDLTRVLPAKQQERIVKAVRGAWKEGFGGVGASNEWKEVDAWKEANAWKDSFGGLSETQVKARGEADGVSEMQDEARVWKDGFGGLSETQVKARGWEEGVSEVEDKARVVKDSLGATLGDWKDRFFDTMRDTFKSFGDLFGKA